METYKERDISKPFALSPEGLRSLIRALGVQDGSLKLKAKCKDGSSFPNINLEDLVAFPNPKSRAIDDLSISARVRDKGTAVTVRFRDWMTPISYEISGEDDDVVALSRTVEDHIESMTQGYGVVATGVAFPPFLIAIAALLVLGGIAAFQRQRYLASAGIMFAASVFSFFSLPPVLPAVFPIASFRIGDGERRYQKTIQLRRQLLWGVVAALIVGVISGLIANRISR